MRRLSLLAIALLAASAGRAQEGHFVPDRGPLAAYEHEFVYGEALRASFATGEEGDRTLAQLLVAPSFGGEWVVRVVRSGERALVRYGRPEGSVWSGIHVEQPDGTTAWEPVPQPVTWAEAELSVATADAIAAAWGDAVRAARYPEHPTAGLDGVTVHASAWVFGLGVISARAWSPAPDTVPGRLVGLGDALRQYALGELDVFEVAARLRALRARLDASD